MKVKSIFDAIRDYNPKEDESVELSRAIKFDLLLNRKKTNDWVKSNKRIVTI